MSSFDNHGHAPAATGGASGLHTRPRSVQELVQASNFYFDQTPSLTSYVRGAENLRRQSSVYEKEGDYETAFIMLTRSVKLALDHIPRHREFAKADGVVSQQLLKTSKLSMEDMKRLKPKLKNRYERWEAQQLQETSESFRQASVSAYEAREAGYEDASWLTRKGKGREKATALERSTAALAKNASAIATSYTAPASSSPLPPAKRTTSYIPFAAPLPVPSPLRVSSPIIPTSCYDSPFYTPFIPYSPSPTPARDPFTVPLAVAPVRYPDLQAKVPQSSAIASRATAVASSPRDARRGTATPNSYAMYPNLPPPQRPYPAEPALPAARTEGGLPLRNLVLPADLVDTFAAVALNNTRRNLETCGLIMGQLSRNVFTATLLLIPKQSATSDTCTTQNEEDIFAVSDARDVLTLGWIHTHPRQSCFLSSLDLHTHCSYQQMLPEAIAVVVAPTSTPSIGIFRITDPPGLGTIGCCKEKGLFHPHPDVPIYTDADGMHVVLQKGLKLEVIDVR